MSKQFWIVWNDARVEGFVTDDYEDACKAASKRRHSHASTLGEAFREIYEDDEAIVIEEYDLDTPPALKEALASFRSGACTKGQFADNVIELLEGGA